MRFEQIHIDSFGLLRAFDLTLQPGVNILEGHNEAGKSTLCAFLTYMLYGLPKAGREQYLSWETGTMGGYLTLTDGERRYRIERATSPAGRETLRVIDLSTNTQCFRGEVPGERLLGLPESLFGRTAYVSQTDGAAVAGGDLSEAIGNLLFSGDESVNTQKVLKKLDEARIPLLYKNKKGGEIYSLEAECDLLRVQIERASAASTEIIGKESSLEETEAALTASEKKHAALGAIIACEEAAALSAQFDRLHEAEAIRDGAQARMRALDAENRFGTFLPDAAYPDRLSAAIGESERAAQTLLSAEAAYSAAEQQEQNVPEREAFRRRLEAEGGGRAIVSRCRCALEESKKWRRLAYLTLIFIIPAILFFRRSNNAHKEAEAILTSYRCGDLEQLTALMDRAASDAARLDAYHRSLREHEEHLTRSRQAANHADECVSALTALWGRTDPEATCEDARAFLSQSSAARADYERAASLADGLRLPLRGRDEEEIRSRLVALTAEGVSSEGRDMAAVRREYDYLTHALNSLREKKHDTEKSLIALKATAVSPAALQDRLNAAEGRLRRLRRRYHALVMAYTSLESAAGDLRESVSPRLSASASDMLHRVTSGKYGTLGVARDMSMEYTAQGEGGSLSTHGVDALSAGTRDAAYVALRLSLLQLLCRRSMPPVIFDESFSRLDDTRLRAMLAMIASYAKEGNQVILLTSSGRDAAAAGDDPIFHRVTL